MLDGGPRIAQVVAEEPTRCLALASWDFERRPARSAGGGAGGAAGASPARLREVVDGPPDLAPADRADVTAGRLTARPARSTFLFTDIEGSTTLVDALGTAAWRPSSPATGRSCAPRSRPTTGSRSATEGDSFFVVFARPARRASRRRRTPSARWPPSRGPDGAAIRVRMGIHTGEASSTPTGRTSATTSTGRRASRPRRTAARCCSPRRRRTLVGGALPDGVAAPVARRPPAQGPAAGAHRPARRRGAAGRLPADPLARRPAQQPADPADGVRRP